MNGNGGDDRYGLARRVRCLGTPILITNTHSVGVVRDAVIEWNIHRGLGEGYTEDSSLPVVAETCDGFLNDVNGFHVRKEHVLQALDAAASGPVAEGNLGGGAGMRAHGFKAVIGTSLRGLDSKDGAYTVGVLVQANYGARDQLRIAGVPVGKEISDLTPVRGDQKDGQGSIIVVVATDAPLLPHQLKRLASRVSLGIGFVGGRGENSSGDLFVGFSTANAEASKTAGTAQLRMLPNEGINPLFRDTVDATEEAIINSLVTARTMTGINGNTGYAIPHDPLRAVLSKYQRLVK